MEHYDVIVVGAGLAGLTAALQLSADGHNVLVFEKHTFPRHKVCGEYVSNEVMPYLQRLGVFPFQANAVSIDTLQMSTSEGKSITTKLPLGGVGISRFALDQLLYQKAISQGVSFMFETVSAITYKNDGFELNSSSNTQYTAKFVIGAFGKRSNLDKQLKRSFINQKSSWLGVKAHYDYDDFPDNLVALHNFKGGYGGLSKTEAGVVNFCYLASYKSFKKEKNIHDFNANVVSKNPFLNNFLSKATMVFEEPLSIAQISFHSKKTIEDHVLMCGDSAGLIHPLCGNGMAMAIHSAKLASELIHDYFKTSNFTREQLEVAYRLKWNNAFQKRLWMGRRLQSLLLNNTMSSLALSTITRSPVFLQRLIKSTHGKPII